MTTTITLAEAAALNTKGFLVALNEYRAAEGKAPFADWRRARHMPMLENYINTDPRTIDPIQAEPEVEVAPVAEVVAEVVAEKLPSYKVAANHAKSTIEKPVDFVHAFLDENPDLGRKASVIALQRAGVNFSTARTQYQKWYQARKGA